MYSRLLQFRLPIAGAIALALALVPAAALAHVVRPVGGFVLTVGWQHEPAYTSEHNAVQLLLADSKGKPVSDLGDSLSVQIVYQGLTMPAMTLERVGYGAGTMDFAERANVVRVLLGGASEAATPHSEGRAARDEPRRPQPRARSRRGPAITPSTSAGRCTVSPSTSPSRPDPRPSMRLRTRPRSSSQ